jgi:hypothetical protein
MPDHNMSDQACQERAKRYREHEQLKEDVAELFERTQSLLKVVAVLSTYVEHDSEILNELKTILDDSMQGEPLDGR